ncbi:Testis-specific expressed protein 55 [Bulinus truncatus]|nr:Testis-specific expressed protein 55 [Bulinus truncatus]
MLLHIVQLLVVTSGIMSESKEHILSQDYINKMQVPKDYVKPMDDPYNKAISYLEKHNIIQLFQTLTTEVIYHRPNDPLEYLIKEVQRLQQESENHQTKS